MTIKPGSGAQQVPVPGCPSALDETPTGIESRQWGAPRPSSTPYPQQQQNKAGSEMPLKLCLPTREE